MNTLEKIKNNYNENGFISPIQILSDEKAKLHRKEIENIEKKIGSVHNINKIHTILTSTYEIATNKNILDIVKTILGNNILLYNATYLIKEVNDPTYVSWHQDLTYWGFSYDDVVSVWLALSSTNKKSGGMRMIPRSHKNGKINHKITFDTNNMLLQGQTVENVNENNSVFCPLLPGEASFHHGWTLHSSLPNESLDRRMGLNLHYLATHVKQTKHDLDSAVCVSGQDNFKNFSQDIPAKIDLDPRAMKKQKKLEEHLRSIAGRE
mgnify:CR=1 FL=1